MIDDDNPWSRGQVQRASKKGRGVTGHGASRGNIQEGSRAFRGDQGGRGGLQGF